MLPVILTEEKSPKAYAWHSGVAEPNLPTNERTTFGLGSDIVHFPMIDDLRLPSRESIPAAENNEAAILLSSGKKAGKLMTTIGDSNMGFANLRLNNVRGTLNAHSVKESPLGGTMDDPLDLSVEESGKGVRPVIPPFWGEIAAAVVEQNQNN